MPHPLPLTTVIWFSTGRHCLATVFCALLCFVFLTLAIPLALLGGRNFLLVNGERRRPLHLHIAMSDLTSLCLVGLLERGGRRSPLAPSPKMSSTQDGNSA